MKKVYICLLSSFLKHMLNWALYIYIVLGIHVKFASLQEEFTRQAIHRFRSFTQTCNQPSKANFFPDQ